MIQHNFYMYSENTGQRLEIVITLKKIEIFINGAPAFDELESKSFIDFCKKLEILDKNEIKNAVF